MVKLDKATLTPEYAVRLGGRGDDESSAVAVSQDNGAEYVYVAGSTTVVWDSAQGKYIGDFPATPDAFQPNHGGGYWDGFVSKIAPDGSLAYSTYLGGNGDDEAYGIFAGEDGVVYVTGWTGGSFPITGSAYQSTIRPDELYGPRDAFLTKFDTSPGDTLLYSTYLGGSGWDYGMAITVDGAGKVYAAGMTRSTDFPPGNLTYGGGSFDGFVAKFNPFLSGLASLEASVLLGGSGSDRCMGVKVAQSAGGSEVYLAGDTSSPNFLGRSLRIQKGYPEVFLVKLGAEWRLNDVDFLKGGNIDYGRALDVGKFERDGETITEICLTGGTSSNNFTTYNPSYPYSGSFDAFVAKFAEGGQEPEAPKPPKPPKN